MERFYQKRRITGKRGEAAAIRFLKKRGYSILDTNYRCRSGEIDIVAREKDSIVFVEVKTRTSIEFGLPEESLSTRKMAHLTKVALTYLSHRSIKGASCRFDVVSVLMKGQDIRSIRLTKDAFPSAF
ncbi:YraN family protein [Candidatus Aerophobetes bacterium]|nr:YraN family protein [Candidatus Aerophobetes bacterium]